NPPCELVPFQDLTVIRFKQSAVFQDDKLVRYAAYFSSPINAFIWLPFHLCTFERTIVLLEIDGASVQVQQIFEVHLRID
ncbi:MAG: hypothetical protein D5S00_07300, partial [Tindallia sp. MSAO_Bac2]